jgi:hypothetical protein
MMIQTEHLEISMERMKQLLGSLYPIFFGHVDSKWVLSGKSVFDCMHIEKPFDPTQHHTLSFYLMETNLDIVHTLLEQLVQTYSSDHVYIYWKDSKTIQIWISNLECMRTLYLFVNNVSTELDILKYMTLNCYNCFFNGHMLYQTFDAYVSHQHKITYLFNDHCSITDEIAWDIYEIKSMDFSVYQKKQIKYTQWNWTNDIPFLSDMFEYKISCLETNPNIFFDFYECFKILEKDSYQKENIFLKTYNSFVSKYKSSFTIKNNKIFFLNFCFSIDQLPIWFHEIKTVDELFLLFVWCLDCKYQRDTFSFYEESDITEENCSDDFIEWKEFEKQNCLNMLYPKSTRSKMENKLYLGMWIRNHCIEMYDVKKMVVWKRALELELQSKNDSFYDYFLQ